MKHKLKSFLTTPFVCLILIISMFALPISANAEAGTLGTETPDISCVFYNKTNLNKQVDGNRLSAGKYKVDIVLSGMKAVSIVELTATYDQSVITNLEITSTYADSHSDMKEGGRKFEDGKVSVFQVSENDDASAIDTNGTVMVSLSVTVASSCDFADVFAFSKDPNLCFVEASYLDGYEDCYVLDLTKETTFKKYLMTANASPDFTVTEFDVSGILTVASDVTGTASTAPVSGVTAVLKKGDEVVKTVTTQADGSYVFAELTEGEYTVTFTGDSTIDRTINVNVALNKANYDQITIDNVGICVVDYNKDNRIDATDVALFSKAKPDLDGNGAYDDNDVAIFKTFLFKTVNYTQLSY